MRHDRTVHHKLPLRLDTVREYRRYTKIYPLAASSGFAIFTLFEVLLSVPYGVRSIKNGSGSPRSPIPPAAESPHAASPHRASAPSLRCVYIPSRSARCGASCALDTVTTRNQQTCRKNHPAALANRHRARTHRNRNRNSDLLEHVLNIIHALKWFVQHEARRLESETRSSSLSLARPNPCHLRQSVTLTQRNRLRRNRARLALPSFSAMRPIAERPLRRHPAAAKRDRRLARQIPLIPIHIHQEIGPSTRNGPFGRTVIFTAVAAAGTAFKTSSDITLLWSLFKRHLSNRASITNGPGLPQEGHFSSTSTSST